MTISGLEACSLIDYPGQLSCVLFSQGCNYDCFYCHNRSLLRKQACIMGYRELQSFLEKRVGFLEAVVFSGGEPTLNDDIKEYVALVRSLGFKTKLDTNGSKPEIISILLAYELLDYVAVDVKAPSQRYQEMVGRSGDASQVKESISLVSAHQCEHPFFGYEIRTTLCPTLTMHDLVRMATEYPPVKLWYLQQYRKPVEYKADDEKRINLPALELGEVEKNLSTLKVYQPNLIIRK